MADQPATPPAADPANPQDPGQQPGTPPADNNPSVPPAASPVTLTDDQKTYLKSQGLTDADLSAPDALVKIIGHAQASQKSVAEYKNQLDKVKDTVVPPPADPNPFGAQPQPTGGSQPQPNNPDASNKGLDPATAFVLTSQLATSFPHLKDKLTNGDFYKEMTGLGIPLKDTAGQTNLEGILRYGKLANDQAEVAAKLEELNKPGDGAIPTANPAAPVQPAADTPMTKQVALAILSQDKNHARAAEATKFLQDNIGK